MTDLHFGECPYCDGYIERPFWDNCCFDCQDGLRELDEQAAERYHSGHGPNPHPNCPVCRAANNHPEPEA